MLLKGLLILAVVVPAAPAFAQSSAMAARGALNDQAFYAERMHRQSLNGPAGGRTAVADPDQNPRRARRAEAAAALINAGDCPGALALAEREHDSRLAARINLVCSTTTVSAPTQTSESPN